MAKTTKRNIDVSVTKKLGKKASAIKETPKQTPKRKSLKETLEQSRLAQVGLGFVLVIIIALVVFGAYNYIVAKTSQPSEYVYKNILPKEEENNDPIQPRHLDGVMVAKGDANKYPVAVMIENLSSIRPQSGLSKAGVVYETLAEGGIARLMAIYAGEEASEIHPVRSARPYYLEWSSEYDAAYAHCGGSPEALELISAFDIPDLNQIGGAGQYFWRGAGTSPHNLYTSTELLTLALRDRDLLDKKPTYKMWPFKDEAGLEDRPTEDKFVKVNFSSLAYQSEYRYDRESNDYLRFNGGVEHIDALTGEQLRAKNVIVQRVPAEWPLPDKGRIGMDVVGSGEAYIFRDGETIEGTWTKKSREERTRFYDENNDEVELSRGQTWVEVLPGDRSVEYN